MTVRLLIVDDHPVVRSGLRAFLDTEVGMEVVGEASNGREAVELASELCPDVVLMDLVMPEMNGVEATRRIMSECPESTVLVLTSFGSDDKLFPAIKAGALGYLLKDASPSDLARAIREAAAGRSSLDPAVARRLLRELAREHVGEDVEPLTPREIEVLGLLARGMANVTIARELFISEPTVRTHVSNILAKLGLANRTQAALHALRVGIASLDDL